MPETTPLIKAALNLRGGAGFDVYAKKVLAIERLRFPSKCSVNKNPHPSLIERWGFTIIQ